MRANINVRPRLCIRKKEKEKEKKGRYKTQKSFVFSLLNTEWFIIVEREYRFRQLASALYSYVKSFEYCKTMTTNTSEQTIIDTGKNSAPTNAIADDKPLNSQPTPVEVVAADDITTSKPAEETVLINDSTNLETQVKTTSMGPTASAITFGLSTVALCFLVIIAIIPRKLF